MEAITSIGASNRTAEAMSPVNSSTRLSACDFKEKLNERTRTARVRTRGNSKYSSNGVVAFNKSFHNSIITQLREAKKSAFWLRHRSHHFGFGAGVG